MKILSKIPFEKGIDSISLNPEENQAFVSENHADSISLIDLTAKTKSKLIEIERPRDIIFEPISNKIYTVCGNMGFRKSGTGKRLSVIDVNAKQIIKNIGNKEGLRACSSFN